MSENDIQYTVEEDELRATIILDRPDSLNALTGRMKRELCRALDDAERNPDVRGVVLTGRGERAFSAGNDLQSEERTGEQEEPASADDYVEGSKQSTKHIYKIWELDKPVVAAINGYCLAAASDLAMVCDILIASESATFGYPGQRIAGHPPTLTYPFFMGIHQAKELLFTGKMIDAQRGYEMGIFNQVVPDDDLMEEAYSTLDQIKKVPGNGVRIQKHSINAVAEIQGFRSVLKNSEFLNALAHLTDLSTEFNDVARESDGLDERLQWMNDTDKKMRETVEPPVDE